MTTSRRDEPVHLQTDWAYVACRKREQKGQMRATRNPGEVTCPRCIRAQPYAFPERMRPRTRTRREPLVAVAHKAVRRGSRGA